MWTYIQETGEMIRPDGVVAGVGYSGFDSGKNNPTLQNVENTGPIPQGVYRIGHPYDSNEHGPFVLPLTPDSANEMWGRGGFLIHGDSVQRPGLASKGCIIQGRITRDVIDNSVDRGLTVVANRMQADPLPPRGEVTA